jgi:dihydrofolate synthase/folylpolyglutamate synthase
VIESPVVSVITTISLDHTKILGDTIDKIAFEKAGIIKEGRPVAVYGGNSSQALGVIRRKAKEKNSQVTVSDFEAIGNVTVTETGYRFDYQNMKNLEINLFGRHQIKNACLAVDAAKIASQNGFAISSEDIRAGLEKTKWPGRMEIIGREPLIICDATHNPEGARVLRDTLDERFGDKRIVFVMGVMKDKDYENMARIILKGAYGAVATKANWHRALGEKVLLQTVSKYCENSFSDDTIERAMDRAIRMAGKDGLVCTTGSLYYVGDVKKYVREHPGGA